MFCDIFMFVNVCVRQLLVLCQVLRSENLVQKLPAVPYAHLSVSNYTNIQQKIICVRVIKRHLQCL